MPFRANRFFVVLLLLITHHAFAFDCESKATGFWNTASTWNNCNNTVPQDNDTVVIKDGHIVGLSANTQNLESFFIESGGDLRVFEGATSVVVINTNNSAKSSIDLSNAELVLENNLTIQANNKNILLGAVDGAYDLGLISSAASISFEANIGNNLSPLKNLTIESTSPIILSNDVIHVIDTVTFNNVVELENDMLIKAQSIIVQDEFRLNEYNITLETTSLMGFSQIVGVISGSGNLIKNGEGIIDLASINTLTGNLMINQGSVFTSNSNINIISFVPKITVADNGSFDLHSSSTGVFKMRSGQRIQGNGHLGSASSVVRVVPNAFLEPGLSTGAIFAEGIRMDTGSTLDIEVDGLMLGTEYDQLVVDTLILDFFSSGGATLNLSINENFTPSLGDQFKIIDVTGNTPIDGTFLNLPEGRRFIVEDHYFEITYLGGNGNDVVITAVEPGMIYVDADAIPAGNGQSWETAFDNLQDALVIATIGDEIWVAEGVYYPDVGGSVVADDQEASFEMVEGVSIYGGFNGAESFISERNPKQNITILSGDITQNDDNNDGDNIANNVGQVTAPNSYHIVIGTGLTTDTYLDGFVITSGTADGDGDFNQAGGGIYCTNETGPAINQVQFQGNFALKSGAAAFGCSQQVTSSVFINNHSNELAGAIYNYGGYFDEVVFSGNHAEFFGGAIFNNTNLPTVIANSKFINNSTDGSGAGVFTNGDVDFVNVLFSGNRATQDSSQGAAMYLSAISDVRMTNSTVTGNRAGVSSIYSRSSGMLNINNSIIWNNLDATGQGTLSSSISHETDPSNITIANSLIQGSGGSNNWNIATGNDGGANFDEDPLFILNTDPNIAPTTAGDAHLQPASIAIDTGDNSGVITTTDLDGYTRIINLTVDIGAYEFNPDIIFKNGFD